MHRLENVSPYFVSVCNTLQILQCASRENKYRRINEISAENKGNFEGQGSSSEILKRREPALNVLEMLDANLGLLPFPLVHGSDLSGDTYYTVLEYFFYVVFFHAGDPTSQHNLALKYLPRCIVPEVATAFQTS